MNRTFLAMIGMFSASSLFLLDSAVKGAAILAAAACAAIILRRDSAATRHLVWLLAIVALLAAPLLSAVLPQWRVLPEWTAIAPVTIATPTDATPVVTVTPAGGPIELPSRVEPVGTQHFVKASQPTATTPQSSPAVPPTFAAAVERDSSWTWRSALPLLWAIGFSVLCLRLAAARLMLWKSERQAMVIEISRQRAGETNDPLVTELQTACLQLEISSPMKLLIHPQKTIPVVWGIRRSHLLLPAAAREWSGEQLRSVLLHELAHVKRRDTLAQLLSQIACALHWFNPLAWFAAWRLAVERERACDDLVLAGGVRPSAYAGHLLEVVSACSPARWTQSCGLAMARKSSLEGRLVAVLSDKLNRRGVSLALAAIALTIAAGIAVPIAMLRAADDKSSEKPAEKTAEKSSEQPKPATTTMKPKHEYAQSLIQKWQAAARTDGKIPGALIGQLALEVDSFLKQYPKDEKSPKLAAILPRLDASHDWSQDDVVALLDDITAISTAPVSWTDFPFDFSSSGNIQPGRPLPADLATAAWGEPAANGLRAAWLLQPVRDQYALGTVLKSRVLFHNAGKKPVVFKTDTWHQYDHHTAHDAKGAEIKVSGLIYTGITPSATYRLAPGEYCEVMGHGIAIGAGKYEEEFSTGSVGAVLEAKEGDDVRLSHTVDATSGDWSKPDDPKDPAELWKKRIAERVAREAPMPQSNADREQLIRRATLDILGEPPTAKEIAAFVADNAPDALAKLTGSLQVKPRVEPWRGQLTTGETKFHVTAVDPDAAKKPKTANTPGRYVLGDNIHLLVSQTTTEARRANKAVIAFLSPDPKVASPHKPYEIELPDGLATYGIAWERGTGELWVVQKGLVRKYDFTNPDNVKETRFDEGGNNNLPEQFREPLKTLLGAPGAPVQRQESLKPKGGERLEAEVEQRLKWGTPVNGLRAALVIRSIADKPNEAGMPDLYLLVQNVSDAAIHLNDTIAERNVRYILVQRDELPQGRTKIDVPTMADATLQPREVTFLRLCPRTITRGQLLAAGMLKEPHMVLVGQLTIEKAPEGAWTGTLVSGETNGAAAQIDPPEAPKAADPPHERGGVKIEPAIEQSLKWGEAVNGLRAAISIRKSEMSKPGDLPDLYLVIQNVSNGPVHLTDADVPANVPTRTLYQKKDGAILFAMGAREPGLGNVVLQPREVVILPVFDPDKKLDVPADPSLNKHTIGSHLVEGALKEPRESFAATFEIEKAPAGAWTGKLLTADVTAAIAAGKPQPKDKSAQALYEIWQRHARISGNFPGGLIARLTVKVKEFIKNNTGDASGDPYAKKMAPIVPRLDASRDWTPAEVITLFDDIAAVTPIPLETMLEDIEQHSFQTGSPLPPALANAPWGETNKNGLRTALLIEPRSGEHPLDTPLKARILIHNAGKDVVVFRTRAWHQLGHKANVNIESVQWLTIGRFMSYRLWPGEFVELIGPGIDVGANKNNEVWQNTNVGSWLDAKAGDKVTITTSPLPLYDWNEKLPDGGEPQWWLDFIKAHLALELPLPADAEERKHLVYRAGMAIFGTPLSAEEINSFVSDRDPNALDSLAKRLAKRPGTTAFAGDLTSGPTKFRVLPADPDAAKKPRVAINPGNYTLGDNANFVVSRRPIGERIASEAGIQFSMSAGATPDNLKRHVVHLPDGYGTWAAAWVRGSNVLWIMQRWGIWSYDFSNPADVKETHIEHADAPGKVPKPILDALHAAVDFSGVNGKPPASASPAK
jgi:beta-lactamase regulating signal transducer with metallopeptidase domain